MHFASHPGLQHPALLKRYSSNFDDASFPDQLTPYDPTAVPSDPVVPESPSVDRDNKLLSFSMPIYNFTLLDYSLRRTSLSLSAQMHGMFFLAESPFTSGSPDQPPPPPELTCYRRNLFQITGSITLPRTLRYIMTDQGDRIPILAQELTISATESVEGNPVKIISVPWKTPAGGSATAEEKVEKEPPSIPLDTMAGQDMDADYATFPVTWKRLQFRIATANNGRRKELQQHFVIRLKIIATLSTGAKVSVAESHSGAIIVRGRSPRNFQSRKDFPLGNSASSRKSQHASITRTSTGESSASQVPAPPKSQAKTPPEAAEVPPPMFHFEANDNGQNGQNTQPTLNEWQNFSQEPKSMMTGTPPISTPTFPTQQFPQSFPPWPANADLSPHLSLAHPAVAAAMNPPISLSFSDDEGSPSPSSVFAPPPPHPAPTSNPSPRFPRPRSKTTTSPTSAPKKTELPRRPPYPSQPRSTSSVPQLPSSKSLKTAMSSPGLVKTIQTPTSAPNSTDEPVKNSNTDHLYEYFPLGLDDWMPPVDAVYRPHVVHHTGPMPLDPKGLAAGRFRSKRYFSEDG